MKKGPWKRGEETSVFLKMDLCNVNDIIIIVYLCSIGLTNENNGRPWNKALLTSVKKLEQKSLKHFKL